MYKLKQKLQESGKMAVTPEQSECLQKALFEIGYEWVTLDEQESIHTNKPYLFWDEDMTITYSDCDVWFNNHFEENPLHKFEDYLEQ